MTTSPSFNLLDEARTLLNSEVHDLWKPLFLGIDGHFKDCFPFIYPMCGGFCSVAAIALPPARTRD